MTGRALIDFIVDNNLEDYEFFFNAADDHSCILPIEEQNFNVGINNKVNNEYYSDIPNPPETILIEAV